MARITAIAVFTLAAGCAAGARPLQFHSRPAPAQSTVESDEALMARGYVCLGEVEVAVESKRCRGTQERPGQCQQTDPATESTGLLLVKAGHSGADLVRIERHRQPSMAPWLSIGCHSPQLDDFSLRPAAICIPTQSAVIGTRHLLVSTGTIWRREPQLVPNMLLARAVASGDEARVADTLTRVRNIDAYLFEAPLVIAARSGHGGVLRRLLGAGARAGKDQALLAAVGRSDLAMTEQLLAAGADPDTIAPGSRERPLHVAAFQGASRPVLERLLAAGADPNALNGSDHMPLQDAILGCHVDTASILIAAGANTSWALADKDAMAIARHRCPTVVTAIEGLMAKR